MKNNPTTNNEKLMHTLAHDWAKIESRVQRIEEGKLLKLKSEGALLKAKLRALVQECVPEEEGRTFHTPHGEVVISKTPLVWKLKVTLSEFRKRFHNRFGDEMIDRCFKADITKIRGLFEGEPEEQDPSLIEKQAGSRTVRYKAK